MKVVILTASAMKKEIDGTEYTGKCVTALNLENNKIVRLVRNRQGAPMENPYCNNYHPLDVIDIEIYEQCPLLCQTENVLSDYRNAKHLGSYSGGIQSIYQKLHNEKYMSPRFILDGTYKLDDIAPYDHSLEIIPVTKMLINGRKCSFNYQGRIFRFVSITDPEYVQNEGTEKYIGNAYLAISIPTNGIEGMGYYKFVASVFPI